MARHCWRPKTARFVAHSLPAGGARYWPVDAPVEVDGENERLDLPGQPRLIHAPGHTPGHAVVVLEERGVVFCGDALVNLDCLSGRRGVQMHRLNEDARQSLDRLATIDADILLFGHGDPWIGPLGRALEHVPSRSSPGPQV